MLTQRFELQNHRQRRGGLFDSFIPPGQQLCTRKLSSIHDDRRIKNRSFTFSGGLVTTETWSGVEYTVQTTVHRPQWHRLRHRGERRESETDSDTMPDATRCNGIARWIARSSRGASIGAPPMTGTARSCACPACQSRAMTVRAAAGGRAVAHVANAYVAVAALVGRESDPLAIGY